VRLQSGGQKEISQKKKIKKKLNTASPQKATRKGGKKFGGGTERRRAKEWKGAPWEEMNLKRRVPVQFSALKGGGSRKGKNRHQGWRERNVQLGDNGYRGDQENRKRGKSWD